MKTAQIVATSNGPAVVLPEEFRFEGSSVAIRRDGAAVILEPIKPADWPPGFFSAIRIDDPAFQRPEQGNLPPIPAL
jgi:virulence-associated protein VagC